MAVAGWNPWRRTWEIVSVVEERPTAGDTSRNHRTHTLEKI
jgi:hypothetical protein